MSWLLANVSTAIKVSSLYMKTGSPVSQQELNQMGSAKIFLIEKDGVRVIEKRNPTQIEVAFYQRYAEQFNALGIHVPRLIQFDDQKNVLHIEYVPHAVDQAFLLEDDRVIEQLVKLHQLPPTSDGIYHRHQWTPQATQQALTTLELGSETEQFFHNLQQRSAHLFDGQNLISGDSNAGNWGQRENGELVLFDWERFSTGHVAIDLAPLIEGMGTFDDYLKVAGRYIKFAEKGETTELARDIGLAKAWIVVEVVNILVSRKNPQTSKYLDWFRQTLPQWAKSLSAQVMS
ncbi:phosphotransferase [Vibrio parahaemolyticus]|nr:phosphotransferase [Vibrio parahaemolyticus]OXD01769.1 phosphotransferase [Vibrio parahaemolyticus]OXD43169.1 phosphotransferase [Vibrio parahaemolyticus]OYR34385.1 phosphotransferase [Vibrio parahaemolyticus]